MANYVLKNLRLTNPRELGRAFDVVAGCLAEPIRNVSLSLAANSLETVIGLLEGTALNQINAFAWTQIADPGAVSDELLRLMLQGRFETEGRSLALTEDFELPWYDWNGAHSGMMRITYSESRPTPLSPSWANPSAEVIERLSNAVGRAKVKAGSSREDHQWTHSYMAIIPVEMMASAVHRVLKVFDFKDFTASWELQGSAAEITREMEASKALQNGYPSGCYHLFGGGREFSFAVRPNWLTPVLNCSLEDAMRVAKRVFEQPNDVTMSIKRTFVSWRQPDGRPGPRTQGNEIQLRSEKGRFRFFVGIEQFADEDPPVRLMSTLLRRAAAELDAELKPNGLMM